MSYLLPLVVIFALFGCQDEMDRDSSGKEIESTGKFNKTSQKGMPKIKAFRQDRNKTYQDLAGRPWVLARPQKPYKDINFSVFGNE